MALARLCHLGLSSKQVDDPTGHLWLWLQRVLFQAQQWPRRYQWRGTANGLRPCAAPKFESGKGKEIVHAVQQCCPDLSNLPVDKAVHLETSRVSRFARQL